MENKKVIGVVQILQHLKDGMDRNDIAAHYDITKAECKAIFMDSRLKGKKTIKKPTFTLVDDATEAAAIVDVKVIEVKEEETIKLVDDTANDGDDSPIVDTKVEDTKEEETTEVAKATWQD